MHNAGKHYINELFPRNYLFKCNSPPFQAPSQAHQPVEQARRTSVGWAYLSPLFGCDTFTFAHAIIVVDAMRHRT